LHYGKRHAQKQSLIRQLKYCQDILIDLKSLNDCFTPFSYWFEVLNYLKPGALRKPAADNIIRITIGRAQLNSDRRYQDILTAIFWPLLEIIYNYFIRHFVTTTEMKDDLWQYIHWSFLKVLTRIDLHKREGPIASKIYNDVYHDAYLHLKSANEESASEIDIDIIELKTSDIIDLPPKNKEIELADCRCDLEQFRSTGLISDIEYHLLCGEIIYEEPLVETATRLEIGYEFAKKRRQRAVKKIQKSLKKLSPYSGKCPL